MEENKNNQQQQNQFQMGISPEVAEGTYSNLALITHSSSDFILDFACALPGMPAPQIKSRVPCPQWCRLSSCRSVAVCRRLPSLRQPSRHCRRYAYRLYHHPSVCLPQKHLYLENTRSHHQTIDTKTCCLGYRCRCIFVVLPLKRYF